MFCTKCGKEISDDSQFCIHCGAKQTPMVSVPIDRKIQKSGNNKKIASKKTSIVFSTLLPVTIGLTTTKAITITAITAIIFLFAIFLLFPDF